jgi:hypothetical protein
MHFILLWVVTTSCKKARSKDLWGQHSWSLRLISSVLRKEKHRSIPPHQDFCFIIVFTLLTYAFMLLEFNGTLECISTLSRLSLILSWWKSIRMVVLSKQADGRSWEAGFTREISGLWSLLVRVVGYKLVKHLNLRLGEETKGRQVECHRMGRVRVDKKILGAPQW